MQEVGGLITPRLLSSKDKEMVENAERAIKDAVNVLKDAYGIKRDQPIAYTDKSKNESGNYDVYLVHHMVIPEHGTILEVVDFVRSHLNFIVRKRKRRIAETSGDFVEEGSPTDEPVEEICTTIPFKRL